jgi:hypothetical protein
MTDRRGERNGAFFTHHKDDDDNDVVDEGRMASIAFLKQASIQQQSRKASSEALSVSHGRQQNIYTSQPSQAEVLTKPMPSVEKSKSVDESVEGPKPQSTRGNVTRGGLLQRTETYPASSKEAKGAGQKRKRVTTGSLIPDIQRIFSGCTFCRWPITSTREVANLDSLLPEQRHQRSQTPAYCEGEGLRSCMGERMVQSSHPCHRRQRHNLLRSTEVPQTGWAAGESYPIGNII